MSKAYEMVIGLETHVELRTRSKVFCACPNVFGAEPNTHVCPVCMGLPGALPVFNAQVLRYAAMAGMALGCHVHHRSRFDRKNYFYPDLPKAYQISQFYRPLCEGGALTIQTSQGEKRVGITRIHIEEDAGKLLHDEANGTALDMNRCGVPLIEIVSEPDMRTAQEVIAYLEKLRMICQYLGISDCKLQEGSMRADVNLSVREVGSDRMGTRTEMKNLNSFKAITHAIEGERERQIELLEEGKEVIQETRRWDDNKESSHAMRSKEDAKDYRYFPDPDLQPMQIPTEWMEQIRSRQPEFQEERAARYEEQYGLPAYDASILTQTKHMADMFEQTADLCGNPKKTANWLMGEGLRLLKEKGMEAEDMDFTPKHLADLIQAVEGGKINQANAKKVFAKILEDDVEPLAYMEKEGLLMVSDSGAIEGAVDQVLAENPKTVEEFHSGKEKVLGFLVGQVMKKMRGKADPGMVNELLRKKL